MPYIHKDDRVFYDPIIEMLNHQVAQSDYNPGVLNYIISKLIWEVFKKSPCYTTANELMGVLECAKLEFYRRQIAPYEDTKIHNPDNGDLK